MNYADLLAAVGLYIKLVRVLYKIGINKISLISDEVFKISPIKNSIIQAKLRTMQIYYQLWHYM